MKIEILRDNLVFGLSVVSRCLVSKPQLPILSHVLLSCETGSLTLTASNLETTISLSVGAKVESSGEFTVPGKTLNEIVSSLMAEKISLSVKENTLEIAAKGSHLKINGTSAADYPKVLNEDTKKSEILSWEINKTDFVRAVEKTAFCAATDESRAVLTGILVKISKKEASFVTVDGFRLSVFKLPVLGEQDTSESESFIVPAKTFLEVSRIVGESTKSGDEEKKICLQFFKDSGQVLFKVGEIKILSRLISGKFPEYEKIIPSTSLFSITASVNELSKAIKLSSIFARDSSNIVKLKIMNSKLIISANAPEIGENETEMGIQINGEEQKEDFVIAFNYHYLADLLASINSSDLTVSFTGAIAPGVFTLSDFPDFLHLISPVRVQE